MVKIPICTAPNILHWETKSKERDLGRVGELQVTISSRVSRYTACKQWGERHTLDPPEGTGINSEKVEPV